MSSQRRVAVVGGGLAGLVAAGELARQGHHVKLFEATGGLGGKAASVSGHGVTLDAGPTLLTLPHVVRSTFERLGALDLLPRFVELDPQCHYRWGDGARLVAHKDVEATAASAGQLGRHEAAGVRAFYAEAERIHLAAGEPYLESAYEGPLPFMARVARRGVGAVLLGARLATLAELAGRHFRTPQLRQFAGRFATYVGASPYHASAAFALIPHLERAQGVFHPVGGLGALARALAQAAGRAGVELLTGAPARWEASGGRWRVEAQGAFEDFDAVVVNADPLRPLGRSAEPLALSGYVLLLSVDRRLSLPHHSVLFSDDYRAEFDALFARRVPEDPTVYVCHPAASDPTMAEPGRSGLFVMANAGALATEGEPFAPRAAAFRERCLARLRREYPELAEAQLTVVAERTPVDFQALGAPLGSLYGFLPSGRFGPFRRPRIRAPQRGLYFAGGGTHPGGGVPLVMLSGLFAAQALLRDGARA